MEEWAILLTKLIQNYEQKCPTFSCVSYFLVCLCVFFAVMTYGHPDPGPHDAGLL